MKNKKEIVSKEKLIKKLIEQNVFWSYDLNDKIEINDNLLIEHTLIYADVDEINQLFELFSKKKIQMIWEKKIIPDSRYYKLNYYLGICFFNIHNIKDFIEKKSQLNSRYEKLRQLAENNKSRIS